MNGTTNGWFLMEMTKKLTFIVRLCERKRVYLLNVIGEWICSLIKVVSRYDEHIKAFTLLRYQITVHL